jgi:hypothetical protein
MRIVIALLIVLLIGSNCLAREIHQIECDICHKKGSTYMYWTMDGSPSWEDRYARDYPNHICIECVDKLKSIEKETP